MRLDALTINALPVIIIFVSGLVTVGKILFSGYVEAK